MPEWRMRRERSDGMTLSPSVMDVARRRAEDVLEKHFPRIQPAEFENYAPDIIAHDAAIVSGIKKKWEREEIPPEGTIAEGFIFTMIGKTEWFGNNVSITRSAEYDDYVNKVDALLEIRTAVDGIPNNQHIGLGLDATTSTSKLEKKMSGIMRRVHQGTLGTAKYARTSDFVGELQRLPEAVLYIDRANFHDVVSRWMIPTLAAQKDSASRAISDDDMQKFNALATHRLQLEFLVQMFVQLDECSKHAELEIKDKLIATRQIVFKQLQERMRVLGVAPAEIQSVLTAPSVVFIRKAMKEASQNASVQ